MPIGSKYSLGVPMTDFVYTNPAAAQQAADSLRARLGFESTEDQGNRDQASRLNETAGANTRSVVGTLGQLGASKMNSEAMGKEGAANRASSEKIAGMQLDTRQRQQDAQQDNDRNALADGGDREAAFMKQDPNRKPDLRVIHYDAASKTWLPNYQRAAPRNYGGAGVGGGGGGGMGPLQPTAPMPQAAPAGRAFGDSGIPLRMEGADSFYNQAIRQPSAMGPVAGPIQPAAPIEVMQPDEGMPATAGYAPSPIPVQAHPSAAEWFPGSSAVGPMMRSGIGGIAQRILPWMRSSQVVAPVPAPGYMAAPQYEAPAPMRSSYY